MDSSTFPAQGNGASAGEAADDKMEQVRELLYGDYQRRYDGEIAKLEARVNALETNIERRLDALQARLEALSGELTGDRRTSFDELARGLAELGNRMQRIAKE
jgi:hypothetical protein